uniref:NADH-ubiquinone oxidoreductase chain 4L n=1 Tax=Polididus armatissimus TaxID=1524522 RepID=A0A9E8Y7R6_9HEMI|nr:NADH dehydrogenase subunit 4L [Polididus armatissimus]WAJ48477.1 NADH dehydrogenase subunit 4L [Polididus armatissimus]
MLDNYGIFTFVMLFSGLLTFCSMRKHLLLTLLSLEFLSLALYAMLFMYLYCYGFSMYFILIFMAFTVCEAAVGLGILVCLIRGHGNDNVSSLSILVW